MRIAIEGAEKVPAGFYLVLRPAGVEPVSQRTPESIEPHITHFKNAAHVRWFRAIKEQRSFGSIGVMRACPLEHAQRNQRIEKIARAAGMEPEPLGQDCLIEWAIR